MRFQRLDLNLLVALDALLTEKSVSIAADRLCLSQSATSSALGRLRDYFEDDLLVLKGRQMVLTPRAEELIDPVRAVLEQIRTTIAVAPPFDPLTCDRKINIMASDFMTEVLLADALQHFEQVAPRMQFEIQSMSSSPVDLLERGFVDLLVTVDFAISADHPSELLFTDDHVIIGDAANPQLAGEMTEDLYFELGHVTTRFSKQRIPAFEEWFMRRQKRRRRVEVVAPSFLPVPSLVIGTRRIATVHRKMAERMCKYRSLVMRELPFEIPPIREAIQWQVTSNSDAALRWVIEELKGVAASIGSAEGSDESLHNRIAVEFEAERGDAIVSRRSTLAKS